MLIRTQDGMGLVDISGMTLKAIQNLKNDYEIIAYGNNQPSDCVEKLGLYPTKQRAVEVLNDICDTYRELKEYEVSGQSATQPVFVYYMMED